MALLFRSIDGSGNNLVNPLFDNATGTGITRYTAAHPEHLTGGPNPRTVSNTVVGEGLASVANKRGLSDIFTIFGQFIDHTTDSIGGGSVPLNITIPAGDGTFPAGSILPLNRALTDASGNAINRLSGWVDGSMVYGSTPAVAAALRAPDGTLLLSAAGDDLPAAGAGDNRARENDYLTSLHVLFVKEHNFQVAKLRAANPALTPEELFQQAKAIVDAEIADIAFNEWLPLLLGKPLATYSGYKANVDARISTEFVAAAFRFGHSLVGDDIEKLDPAGNVLSVKSLAADFLDGGAGFTDNGGAGALLRAQAAETANALDARIVPELRNFLVDGGPQSDLAALNIQRGRDLAVGHLNEVREGLGLKPHKNFNALTNDKATADALSAAYGGNINAVELWVGGLAETPHGGALIGDTFKALLTKQFTALRDGDRLYFENPAVGFTAAEIAGIKATSLSDIIERNTGAPMQDNVFVALERSALPDLLV